MLWLQTLGLVLLPTGLVGFFALRSVEWRNLSKYFWVPPVLFLFIGFGFETTRTGKEPFPAVNWITPAVVLLVAAGLGALMGSGAKLRKLEHFGGNKGRRPTIQVRAGKLDPVWWASLILVVVLGYLVTTLWGDNTIILSSATMLEIVALTLGARAIVIHERIAGGTKIPVHLVEPVAPRKASSPVSVDI